VIKSKIVRLNLATLALLGSASVTFADVTVPTIPTNGPSAPTTIPTIPTGTPSVPTSTPTVPTSVPTIPTGSTSRNIYAFSGFRAPIVNNGITNTTKGKSVRFGWNLTDASGANVTNPAVVVDRFYREIDCNTDVASSGLNPAGIKLNKTTWNKGRKDLEFSWSVPNLRKSCLLFTVVFDDAQTASAKFYVK
jgi:hypothetical protein